MRLEEIGFYTLSDKRAMGASATSRLQRCELLLTSRCNFNCPYCRKVGGKDISYELARSIIIRWSLDGLKNIRLSGGEPTVYPNLVDLCNLARLLGAERIAISTNGSALQKLYDKLLKSGVNDFSISLDACCGEDGDFMAGGIKGSWDTVIKNIKWLAARTYTTVGVVLTKDNLGTLPKIVELADGLGVSDIRIIPSAQDGRTFKKINIPSKTLNKYPILKYRVNNFKRGRSVRGLTENDSPKCGLVLDDMAVCGNKHHPCIIYLRESGNAIGFIGNHTREQRKEWFLNHDTFNDPICRNNCLDVCVDYNNKFMKYHDKG